jgi:hypothetical protein
MEAIFGSEAKQGIMKEIYLTQNKVTQVDDEDFAELSKFKWKATKDGNTWYAGRWYKGNYIIMHRVIMQTPTTLVVDHKDGDGLNNQKYNLRNCSVSTNTQNMQHRKTQGVTWVKARRKFRARITVNGSIVSLGVFLTEAEAALAYNKAATLYFGQHAKLNIGV